MKTLLLFVAFFTISTFSNAQLAMNTSSTNAITVSNTASITKKKTTLKRTLKTIEKHNQAAAKQLSTHLNKELQYSPIMQNYCMEGMVVIEVKLSKTGDLVDTKIIDSPNTEVDKVVIEAMSNLRSIQFKNNDYHGSKRIQIPISFSLR